jgi:hypothetical protein
LAEARGEELHSEDDDGDYEDGYELEEALLFPPVNSAASDNAGEVLYSDLGQLFHAMFASSCMSRAGVVHMFTMFPARFLQVSCKFPADVLQLSCK